MRGPLGFLWHYDTAVYMLCPVQNTKSLKKVSVYPIWNEYIQHTLEEMLSLIMILLNCVCWTKQFLYLMDCACIHKS